MPNGWARPASRPSCSTATTTCSRPIRWTSGNRRPSSPRSAATISSRAAPADDKGQVFIQIKAVEGLLKSTGKLPVNVKFLLEGEEETGGEHIEAYVKTRPPRLQADAAVVCDTEMFAPELPTICVGLRGMVYYELFVQGATTICIRAFTAARRPIPSRRSPRSCAR